ncbi:Chemotaxis protein CheY [Koleobacter methoxysyntrophicus]|jgi:two-component system chemotaxis response regulator CheY|uniref:Stage 0 sporulation protein A homolog n=1 Tax=Koleobacter methoxysyntrophicus TaxID=2751313 RepID=A0A8A0RPI4_9FIRM|nr:response regulator [Koleobacter methoxysyntrophicus]NPV44680.1 response regulator [Bacillota bacterium]QSQ09419.1 Chemotaxis protein CheY [Koleobacter methoxysyntrophicus]
MSPQVLIVEDSAFMRANLKKILTSIGLEQIYEAENGIKAVEKYQRIKPDLVIMDITMPEMDGISAVKQIKALDPNARIIMCSAMGQQALIIEAIQAGARDFVVKPFNETRLIEAVKKGLN